MVNGAHKGSAFERQLAKTLSLWLTGGKKADSLWRTAASGGRATIAHRKGEVVRQAGDLCAVAPEAEPFCSDVFIEAKHLKRCSLTAALSGKGPLVNIWRKLLRQARDHLRFPILIVKQNNKPTLWVSTATVARMIESPVRAIIHVDRAIVRNGTDMHVAYLEDVLKAPVPRAWKGKP